MPNRENTNLIEEILKESACEYERHDCLDVDVFPCQIADPTGRSDSLCQMIYVGDSAIEVELELDQKAADRKAEMAEFLTRANNGISVGKFTFGWDDGAIAFKASCPVSVLASPDGRTAVASFLELPEKTVAKYAKGIDAVLDGRTTPKDALHMCEGCE